MCSTALTVCLDARQPLGCVDLWLQLNPDKLEVVLVGMPHISFVQLPASCLSTLPPAGCRFRLSWNHSSQSTHSHASNMARACNYHTQALWHVYLLTRQLDYCNALLYDTLVETLKQMTNAEQLGKGCLPERRSFWCQTVLSEEWGGDSTGCFEIKIT